MVCEAMQKGGNEAILTSWEEASDTSVYKANVMDVLDVLKLRGNCSNWDIQCCH